ncbi:tRNA modification GTPase GTPBP3, mitochondrial, partial [Zootermopsis nevadensis]
SGYGKCGVAVIRISGPNATEAIINIAKFKSLPQPRQALLRSLKDPVTNDTLDRGLVLWFPGPNSFTGEDSCELQIHGGPAVISAVLREFTKRAFHRGKLDLVEVEGLADLIHAETETQRKQAFLQMEGSLSHLYNSWRESLIKSVAHVEAFIDFSEDENIEDNVMDVVEDELKDLKNVIQSHLADGRCGERLRDGVRTVIVGEPNVGKSSLLNALCQRPAAIVTPIAGTTRDVVELHVNIGGYPVIIADTAGLRNDASDAVEKEGISRAHAYAQQADLVILVIDATKYVAQINTSSSLSFDGYVNNYINELQLLSVITKNEKKCIIVLNKTDLLNDVKEINSVLQHYKGVTALSCKTENGIPQLLEKMTCNLTTLCGKPSRENPCLTQSRHRHHLTVCVACLDEYFKLSAVGGDTVLAAQQLRKALRHISKITGHVSTEEILDVIFKDFCIGK